jgi:voltage-gated potassium channel
MQQIIKSKGFSSLSISLGMLFIMIMVGTGGYVIIEEYTPLDALFMTIITISTVGFSEVKPLSAMGELFTIFMIVFSFGAFAYAVTSITRFIVDGGFHNYFINKRTDRKISKLQNHVIICGYGRNGVEATRRLLEKGQKFLIIDDKPEVVNELRQMRKLLYVEGDATDDEVLHLAGIAKAKALITTLPNDADNLLVVLSARALKKDLRIISRASFEWSDVKLRKAGADNVIMPDLVGGRRMAKLVAQKNIIAFLDYMRSKKHGESHLIELHCHDFSCAFQEKTIGELKFNKISGVNIIGLKNAEGQYFFNPDPELKLSANYQLFVMGTTDQLNILKAAVFE